MVLTIQAKKPEDFKVWKAEMLRIDKEIILKNDAILVLNFERNGIPNYIGGAVFLEMFRAFDFGKKIFLYNPVPEGMLKDEIEGFSPIVLNGDVSKIN